MAEAETVEVGDGGQHEDAAAFLRDFLKDGPKAVKEIQAAANAHGAAWATCKRAKKAIGIVAAKSGFDAGWQWEIPEGDQESPKEGSRS